jgi:hypothetical protein
VDVGSTQIDELSRLLLGCCKLTVPPDATLHALNGSKRERWIEVVIDRRHFRRITQEPTIWGVGIGVKEHRALEAAGYLNLAEVAAVSRVEIEAIQGVGPVTVRQIEKALVKHKLDWAVTPRCPRRWRSDVYPRSCCASRGRLHPPSDSRGGVGPGLTWRDAFAEIAKEIRHSVPGPDHHGHLELVR